MSVFLKLLRSLRRGKATGVEGSEDDEQENRGGGLFFRSYSSKPHTI